MDVGTQVDPDNTAPSLDYSFSSDCSKYVFSECSQGSWTIEVKAKDTESGMLTVLYRKLNILLFTLSEY